MISQQQNNFHGSEEERVPTPAEEKQRSTVGEEKQTTTASEGRSATTIIQAMFTTLLAGVFAEGAVILSFPLWMFSLRVFGASNDVLDKTEILLWNSFLLVPIACVGVYWLALFRLRCMKAFRTWLETFGFSLLYWLVLPLVLGVGLYMLQALHLLNQNTGITSGTIDGPWTLLLLVGEAPGLILYAVLLALSTSAIAFGSALFFAKWEKVREAHLKSRGWLEFLLVFGCVSIVTLLTFFAAVYLVGAFYLLVVPGAMLAGIAAWTTYRRLHHAGLTTPLAKEW